MIMNYEKKYKEALEIARKINSGEGVPAPDGWTICEVIFPELKESEDEKIRKTIIRFFVDNYPNETEMYDGTVTVGDVIAWLEKQGRIIEEYEDKLNRISCESFDKGYEAALERQGEQKDSVVDFKAKDWYVSKVDGKIHNIHHSVDKVEPKFKVGNWIVNNQTSTNYLVKSIIDDKYCLWPLDSEIEGFLWIVDVDSEYHLWTIQDAKDGKVLSFNDDTIVIFKDLYSSTTFHSYCHIEDGVFDISKDEMPDWWEGKGFHPATKEQRELLFQKMKEAGYEWNEKEKRPIKVPKTKEETGILKQLIDEEKSAWDEEDVHNIQHIDSVLFYDKDLQEDTRTRLRNWIKSLKDRVQPQPKQEWNKAGRNYLEAAIAFIEQNNQFNYWNGVYKKDVITFLRNLRPQNTWKPSEEQMEALANALSLAKNCGEENAFDLRTLYEQLKKLREE